MPANGHWRTYKTKSKDFHRRGTEGAEKSLFLFAVILNASEGSWDVCTMIGMVHKILPLRYASVRMTFEAFLAFLCVLCGE